MAKGGLLIVSGICCFICIIIGFGIAELVIYKRGTAGYPAEQACGSFPSNLTSWQAEKRTWSQWNWRYSYKGFDGKIEQNCPTVNHDVKVYANGELVMKSDGKIGTTVSKTYLKDCHGNIIYVTRSASAWQTLINGYNIQISLDLRDADEKQLLAYVDANRLFTDNVEIKNATSVVVATMKRNRFSYPWTWEFNILEPGQPGSDPAVLGLLAGKLAFSDSDNTDTCNSFFINVAWMLLAVAIFVACCIGCCIYFTWGDCKEFCLQSLRPNHPRNIGTDYGSVHPYPLNSDRPE